MEGLNAVDSDIHALLNIIREENQAQHGDIVRRLDQINGRVQHHDRELGEVSVQLDELKTISTTVDRIDRDHVTKGQAWVVGSFTLLGVAGITAWILEHLNWIR